MGEENTPTGFFCSQLVEKRPDALATIRTATLKDDKLQENKACNSRIQTSI